MLGTRERPARGRGEAERGSVAVFSVVFAVAVVFLTALIVDGGIALNARGRAADIAGQAARAAADDIDIAALRDHGQVLIAAGACGTAGTLVSQYAHQDSGGLDHVTSAVMQVCGTGADTATVRVTITTKPLIAGVFGGFTESATQTATAECGITAGVEC
ncbi:MAG TPA: pilus assembly protein TadG-related protein [Streptosporangiaceae bacterium]|jgi:Flp pilus assembly protein TadG